MTKSSEHGRTQIPHQRFEWGKILLTNGALAAVPPQDWFIAILRHGHGDWGDVAQADREQNELALEDGSRLMSVYSTSSGMKFWVITEADRSTTTVLLPEEY